MSIIHSFHRITSQYAFVQWANAIFMKKKLTGYDAIIFDMDGTLIDSMPTHLEAWRLTSEKYGFPFDREWQHSLGGVTLSAQSVGQRACLYTPHNNFPQDNGGIYEITGKPLALKRCLENLIGNAIVYGAPANIYIERT
ncbi:HAD family hydrolase [Endozoicomonas sp.]|uniref:HAD family hydrolase n=1 Tax=Endozoicomonas sp. TaxID=1892382 RepID=UPI002885467E|nr:HAD hydrolase-like protein [Endozoicomonas sp.]